MATLPGKRSCPSWTCIGGNSEAPPPQAITEAVSDASFVIAGMDRDSGAWDPVPKEYQDHEIRASLRALCNAFSGPIMHGAPPHITDIIDAAREYVSEFESGPSPSP